MSRRSNNEIPRPDDERVKELRGNSTKIAADFNNTAIGLTVLVQRVKDHNNQCWDTGDPEISPKKMQELIKDRLLNALARVKVEHKNFVRDQPAFDDSKEMLDHIAEHKRLARTYLKDPDIAESVRLKVRDYKDLGLKAPPAVVKLELRNLLELAKTEHKNNQREYKTYDDSEDMLVRIAEYEEMAASYTKDPDFAESVQLKAQDYADLGLKAPDQTSQFDLSDTDTESAAHGSTSEPSSSEEESYDDPHEAGEIDASDLFEKLLTKRSTPKARVPDKNYQWVSARMQRGAPNPEVLPESRADDNSQQSTTASQETIDTVNPETPAGSLADTTLPASDDEIDDSVYNASNEKDSTSSRPPTWTGSGSNLMPKLEDQQKPQREPLASELAGLKNNKFINRAEKIALEAIILEIDMNRKTTKDAISEVLKLVQPKTNPIRAPLLVNALLKLPSIQEATKDPQNASAFGDLAMRFSPGANRDKLLKLSSATNENSDSAQNRGSVSKK